MSEHSSRVYNQHHSTHCYEELNLPSIVNGNSCKFKEKKKSGATIVNFQSHYLISLLF